MILRLLRLRARLWWIEERAKAGNLERNAVYAFLAFTSLFIVWSATSLYRVAALADPDLPWAVFVLSFAVIGLGRLILSLPRTLERGFLSKDLEVWLSAPVPTRALYALKSAEVGVDGSVAGLLSFASAYGFVRSTGTPGAAMFALLSAVGLLAVSGLASQVVALLLVKVMRPQRIRTVTVLLPFIASMAVLFLQQLWIARQISDGPRGSLPVSPGVVEAAGNLWWSPTTWAANLAAGPPLGRWALTAASAVYLVGACAVLFGLGSILFRSVFVNAWQAMRESSGTRRMGTRLEWITSWLPQRISAVVVKDWRTLRRDVKVAIGLFTPVLMILIFVFGPMGSLGLRASPFMLVVVAMVMSGPAQMAFLIESRNVTLLKAAPLTGSELFLAKAAAFGLPAIVFGWAVAIMSGWGGGPPAVVGAIAATTWAVGWMFLFNLALAGLWTDFSRDSARPDPLPSLAGSFGGMVMLGLHALTAAWLLGRVGRNLEGVLASLIGLTLAGATLATCLGVLKLSRLSIRRLDAFVAP